MTIRILEETARTGGSREVRTDENTATSLPHDRDESRVNIGRPGLLIAGFILSAALTAVGSIPATSLTGRRRDGAVAESSTAAVEFDPELSDQVRRLFDQGGSEFFQDGVPTTFSRTLVDTLARHGHAALNAMAEHIFAGHVNPDVVSEALRWLADLNDPATLAQRWSILERTVRDRSGRVRDGAILGFATLDDPRARPVLLEAGRLEQIPELRQLIDKVLEQLDTTHAAATPDGQRAPLV